METNANSAFIFSLLDKFQILSSSGESNQWTDQDLELFSAEYKILSETRDRDLITHLQSTSNLFRVHLPFSKWTMYVASNVLWYYDELVITDPVLDIIQNSISNLEIQKNRLQDALRYLAKYRESIEGGYILLGGEAILPHKTGVFDSTSENLLKDNALLVHFQQWTRMLKKPSPINGNPEDNLTQLLVEYEGMWGENKTMGMHIPKHLFNSGKLDAGVTYDFMTPFTYTGKEELIQLGKVDMLDQMQKEYAKDISIVLESISNSQRFNMPVLFYRDVDTTVATIYASQLANPSILQVANTTVYDFTAPYLKDIPSERIFETKTQIPQAFNEFRYFLQEVVSKTMKITNDPAEIRYRIEHEVSSMLNKLEVEIKIAERKWKVIGLGTPVIAAIGSLGLYSSGIDIAKLASFVLGSSGGIRTLTSWVERKNDKDKISLNPVYFLWKAHKNNS